MAVAELVRDYADLGVSCGYIGNVYWGPESDDRSWRVFTKLWNDRTRSSVSVVVFEPPSDFKGIWRDGIEYDTPEVRRKLDNIRSQFERGELRMR